jgi:hypothetical protein
MKKNLFLLLLLFVFNSVTFAFKNPELFKIKYSLSLKDDLLLDKNIRLFYAEMVGFADKIRTTNTGSLFKKYLTNKATMTDINTLFTAIELKDEAGYKTFSKKIHILITAVINKYSYLQTMLEQDKKVLLKNIFIELAQDEHISVQFTKPLKANPTECFSTWLACMFGCAICCVENGTYWTCFTTCGVIYGLCWVFID